MKVQVLGTIAVSNGENAVSGMALGGRRARVALAALALADGPVAADRLATIIWGDELPTTWAVGLRGVVRGLRAACAPIGGGDHEVIGTTPSGYCLADGVEVDVDVAAAQVHQAAELLAQGRHQLVVDVAGKVARLSGDQLLPGEDAGWLDPHRRAVDATALRSVQLVVEASGLLGQHHDAVATARRAVGTYPLDESTHRALIAALDRAGDRPGAVQAYEHCRALLADELGIDPSTETVGVYLRALRDQADSHAARVPVATSSFVGREAELAELVEAIAEPGLVSLTGKGGVGKSRLAMRASTRGGEFAGGRLWVSLAQVAEDELVAATVAMILRVPLGADDPETAVADHLAPRGRVLLVLDGCEGVVDGTASLVSTLLARAPSLVVLATSRLPLSVEGEQILTVEPMPAPVAGQSLSANGQVRLLVDRVREAGGDLRLDATAAPHLIALCRRCGGLPLALELVAAQLAAMPVGDLLDHLSATTPKEEGLRAIATSSYALLDADEATVFRRLGVLDGPVGLPLVREVVSSAPIAPVRVVRILRELTARGLVSVDRSGPRWRYEQDDDLHRLARELLVDNGEGWAAFDRLADAIRSRLPEDARAAPAPFRAEITELLGSVRSLFGAALVGRAHLDRCLELAFRLHRYFATTNVAEGRFWLSRLLAAGSSPQWTPYATYALGYLSYWSGDTDDAMRDLGTAVRILQGAEDSYRARALIFLAGLLDDVDRGDEAIEHVRMSIEAAAPYDVDLQCSAAMGLGSVLAERVDPEAARYAGDAIALCRGSGSVEQLAIALPTAAMICWQVGDLTAARDYVNEALPLNAGTLRIARVVLLSAAAGVWLADGDIEAAIEFGSTADAEAGELGVEREVPLIRAVLARARLAQDDLVAAAQHAAGALDTALAMSIGFPMAIGLETAALVLHAIGATDDPTLGRLLVTAADLRRQGDRPPPAALAGAVSELRVVLGAYLAGPDGATALDGVAAVDEAFADARAVARRALELLATA
ncbi:MAG: BTAD domain-containing putative transcriptional regulator, partial [Jatrophihabitans sp.]